MSYQSEAQLEQQLIEQLGNQDYELAKLDDYDALLSNFKIQFEKFNNAKIDKPFSDKEWERIFNYISGKSIFESAKILRDKFVIERDDGTKVYLSLLDEDYTKNIFQVTNQTTVIGKYKNRYDVTLLVNGLPLVQIELKRRGVDIKEAVNQIMRYRRHSYQGLYHFIQFFVVSNGVDTKYFANSDKDILYSHTFFWTDDNNIRITNLKDFSVAFLARDMVVKMLTKFTILNDTDKLMMIMRPYQVYATEALIHQATLPIEMRIYGIQQVQEKH
jgi:type I restriction enzyme R subunit